jgi:hypothetical protein
MPRSLSLPFHSGDGIVGSSHDGLARLARFSARRSSRNLSIWWTQSGPTGGLSAREQEPSFALTNPASLPVTADVRWLTATCPHWQRAPRNRVISRRRAKSGSALGRSGRRGTTSLECRLYRHRRPRQRPWQREGERIDHRAGVCQSFAQPRKWTKNSAVRPCTEAASGRHARCGHR